MPAGDAPQPDVKEILYAIEGAERYRTRARSVATITATGAGALAAGLVLNSSSNFSDSTKLFGLAAVILLLLSTAVFVIASVVHSRTISVEKKPLIRFALRPWETLYSPNPSSPKGPLFEQSEAVLNRILKTMDSGMWLAGAAIISLIFALASISLVPPERLAIEISFIKDAPSNSMCPNLPKSFHGTVLKADLDKAAGQLLVTVPASACHLVGESVSFYVNRVDTQIVIARFSDE